MKVLKLFKNNNKFFTSVLIIASLSITNTLEGFLFAKFGFSYIFLTVEFLSLFITILLLNFLWCMIEDGKCVTLSKSNTSVESDSK